MNVHIPFLFAPQATTKQRAKGRERKKKREKRGAGNHTFALSALIKWKKIAFENFVRYRCLSCVCLFLFKFPVEMLMCMWLCFVECGTETSLKDPFTYFAASSPNKTFLMMMMVIVLGKIKFRRRRRRRKNHDDLIIRIQEIILSFADATSQNIWSDV